MFESSHLSGGITIENNLNWVCYEMALLQASEANKIPANSYELVVSSKIDHLNMFKVQKKNIYGYSRRL